MKKLLLTLLVALSLALCESVVYADDNSNSDVLFENSQATSQAFQEVFPAEQETLNQSMLLAQDKKGDDDDDGNRRKRRCKMFCPRYDERCCVASPVKFEKWCEKQTWKAIDCECLCE